MVNDNMYRRSEFCCVDGTQICIPLPQCASCRTCGTSVTTSQRPWTMQSIGSEIFHLLYSTASHSHWGRHIVQYRATVHVPLSKRPERVRWWVKGISIIYPTLYRPSWLWIIVILVIHAPSSIFRTTRKTSVNPRESVASTQQIF